MKQCPAPVSDPVPSRPTVDELKHELMVAMGAAVMSVQFFELYASGCLLALKGDGRWSPEDLFSGDQSRRLPMLRALLSRLYKHFPVDPAFERRMNEFIENRNILIHRFFIQDLGTQLLTTEQELYGKLEFILRVLREATELKSVFAGLYSLLHKAQIAAAEIPSPEALSGYAGEIERYEIAFNAILQETHEQTA